MDYQLFIDGFEDRNITLRVNFFGRVRIFLDGESIFPTNGTYILKTRSGHVVPLRLKRRFLDPVPVVLVGMLPVPVVVPFRWYEYFWLTGLFFLVLGCGLWKNVFGTNIYIVIGFCALFGIPLSYLSSLLFRTRLSSTLKYIITGCSTLIICFAAVIVIAFARVTQAVVHDQSVMVQYDKILKISEQEEIHGHDHSKSFDKKLVPVGTRVDSFGYPILTVDILRIRSLLKNGKYHELDSLLQSYQNLFEKDFHFEDAVSLAYHAFAIPDSMLMPCFNDWVKSDPDHYQPYLARGEYGETMGWQSRGYRWAKDTPEENFQKMSGYFANAKEDFFKALTIEPRLMVAYEVLMDISRAEGEDRASDMLITAGLKLCPYVYRLRERFMMGLLPRWGGSYGAMEAFAQESEKFSQYNPKLHVLHGFVPWDQGRIVELDSNWTLALQLYSTALGYGESPIFYNEMGTTLLDLDRYDEALNNIEKAVSLSPQDPEFLYSKAWGLVHRGEITQSTILLDSVISLDPSYRTKIVSLKEYVAQSMVVQAWSLYQQNRYEEAIAVFNGALAYYPEHAETFYYRGRTYAALEQWSFAVADLKKAIAYDQHNFRYYDCLDWLLSQTGDWATMIDYCDRLISIEPNNARAYLERAKALYHKGDLDAAKKDAEKSCEMGRREACNILKNLNQLGDKATSGEAGDE